MSSVSILPTPDSFDDSDSEFDIHRRNEEEESVEDELVLSGEEKMPFQVKMPSKDSKEGSKEGETPSNGETPSKDSKEAKEGEMPSKEGETPSKESKDSKESKESKAGEMSPNGELPSQRKMPEESVPKRKTTFDAPFDFTRLRCRRNLRY